MNSYSQRRLLSASGYWHFGLGWDLCPKPRGVYGEADALYGYASTLQSVRLRHSGSRAYETGLVRLQFWEALSGEGLGVPASR